jgi:hypothetical protein
MANSESKVLFSMSTNRRLQQYLLLMIMTALSGCSSSIDQSQNNQKSAIETASKSNSSPAPVISESASKKADIIQLSLTTADPSISGSSSSRLSEPISWSVKSGQAVHISADGLIEAVEPGTAELYGNKASGDQVALVIDVKEPEQLDFAADIQPILTRHGCNSGGCHGRLDGQNGFKLSLFGYAAGPDYESIVRQSAGRRVNLFVPSASLLLQKASGQIPHGGGQAIATSSGDFQRLVNWIARGATQTAEKARKLKSLRILPELVRVSQPGPVSVFAIAEYEDGSTRDVSSWASWKSLDPGIAEIDSSGRARVLEPGETHFVVRFGSQVKAVPVQFSMTQFEESAYAPIAGKNPIDQAVSGHLKSLGVVPSPLADDATFLRRVTLDLVGRLPEPAEIRRFVKDPAPDKRDKLVDQLMDDADFNKLWSLRLGDLLQISSARQGNAAPFYLLWLQDQLDRRTSWDEMIRQLLSTRGDPATKAEAPSAYSLENTDPVNASQLAAQRFLGVRIRCAQCHDHPFDVITQSQAHQFAAFFAKVRPSQPVPGQLMTRPKIAFFPQGQHRHPLTGEILKPSVFLGNQPSLKTDADPLPALAGWMTDRSNQMMPRAFGNWLWSQFFASGIVSPVDDLSAGNPPSQPELLDYLGRRFVELGYQIRPLMKEIVTSHTYQLSSESLPENQKFARLNAFQAPRPLTAQQLADALAKATGIPNRFANKPTGTRAIEIQDPTTQSNLLETLGRCDRRDACGTTAGTSSLSLRQSLMWIGSDTVDSKVGAVSGYLRQLMELSPTPAEIIENLYLRTLCRFPSAPETEHFSKIISASSDQAEVVEDLFWALINSREFLFNH